MAELHDSHNTTIGIFMTQVLSAEMSIMNAKMKTLNQNNFCDPKIVGTHQELDNWHLTDEKIGS